MSLRCIVDCGGPIIEGRDKRGRWVRFEFSEMYGPLFLDADGEPLPVQPGIRSAAWGLFEEWNEARFGPA